MLRPDPLKNIFTLPLSQQMSQVLWVTAWVLLFTTSLAWADNKAPKSQKMKKTEAVLKPTSQQCEDFQKMKKKYTDWKRNAKEIVKSYRVQFNEVCTSEKKIGSWQDRNDPYLNKFPGIRDIAWAYQNVCNNPADTDITSYFKNIESTDEPLKGWEQEKKECSFLQADFNRHLQFHINRQILFRRFFQDELDCAYISKPQKYPTFINCKQVAKSFPKINYDEKEVSEWMEQYVLHSSLIEWFIETRASRFYDCPLTWMLPQTLKSWEQCPVSLENKDKISPPEKSPPGAEPAESTEHI